MVEWCRRGPDILGYSWFCGGRINELDISYEFVWFSPLLRRVVVLLTGAFVRDGISSDPAAKHKSMVIIILGKGGSLVWPLCSYELSVGVAK